MVIEGDGRKDGMRLFSDNSVDAIISDHPWLDPKSNKGGNQNFTSDYDCFRYELSDFEEKARVLKPGHFLVEILPEENASNFEYLYQIKKMAEQAGLYYYTKIPWKKGNVVSNTGRKSKNVEDVCFFAKGRQARSLRPDAKKILSGEKDARMSGTSYMLPTAFTSEEEEPLLDIKEFDCQPPSKKERIHQAEKPVSLRNLILEAITLPGEVVIDQYAGSGSSGESILYKKRIGILFEILHSNIVNIASRLGAKNVLKLTELMDEQPKREEKSLNKPKVVEQLAFL
ncbi:DNA methyltransferase [Bacillus salitolerans]|uniref:Methyltransferase n=1 Tax=Bacillus salitolerans TaxID=1437434 RepID=A0ABW4LNJ5_9BACI